MARSVRSASAGRLRTAAPRRAELLGDGGHLGVGVVQPLEGAPRRRRCRPRAARVRGGQREPGRSPRRAASAIRSRRLVDGGLHLDAGSGAALLPPRTQPGREDVAVGGDGGDALAARDQGRGVRRRSATRATRSSSCSTAGRTESGHATTSRAQTAEPSSARPRGGVAAGWPVSPTSSAARPASSVAQGREGAGGVRRASRRRAPRRPSPGRRRRRPRGRP